jgi:hypothetical protein
MEPRHILVPCPCPAPGARTLIFRLRARTSMGSSSFSQPSPRCSRNDPRTLLIALIQDGLGQPSCLSRLLPGLETAACCSLPRGCSAPCCRSCWVLEGHGGSVELVCARTRLLALSAWAAGSPRSYQWRLGRQGFRAKNYVNEKKSSPFSKRIRPQAATLGRAAT